ncbi:predicted protein [Chaetoceros tenuissimus]|uniref:Sulfotransferase n=1 Tax=Chaetoceros tenuissimus TaxID=426638 RepID=A0AAD3HFL2_9STRA|nr:predicted protein [Chaetoceros tenuissimus]
MPAKVAGTSLKKFTKQCVGFFDKIDHTLNKPVKHQISNILEGPLRPPKIITSHLLSEAPFLHLSRHASRSNLIVYLYRDETDRLFSSIKQVLSRNICHLRCGVDHHAINNNGTHCIVNEDNFVVKALFNKFKEIGWGNTEIMTCNFYKSIEENLPNMVFIHYKQVDKLMKVLAKHNCPHLLNKNFNLNFGSEKKQIFLRVKNNVTVPVEDWLDGKGHLLEWAMGLTREGYCQAKTRNMEDRLFSCRDQILQVRG